jgi:PAS domain S-box-containing protein
LTGVLDFRQFKGLGRGWGTTLGIFVLLQALFLMVFSITWRVYTITTAADRENHEANFTRYVASTVQTALADLVNDSLRLTHFIDDRIQRGDSFEDIAADLENGFVWMSRYDEYYTAIRFVGPDGKALLRVTREGDEPVAVAPATPRDWSSHAFFVQGRGLPVGKILLTPIEITDETSPPGAQPQPIVHAAAAVRDPASGALLGLMVVDFNALRLFEGMKKLMAQATGHAAILDQNGRILVQGFGPGAELEGMREGEDFSALYPQAWQGLSPAPQTSQHLGDTIVVGEQVSFDPAALLQDAAGQEASPDGPVLGGFHVVSVVTRPTLKALIAQYPGPTLAVIFGFGLFGLILALFFSNVIALRREASRKLREEVLFRSFVQDTLAEGLVVIDAAGKIISVNKSTGPIFGYEENELVGKDIKLLMNEADYQRHAKSVERYLATGKGRVIGQGPMVVSGVRKDGGNVDLELSVGSGRVQDETLFIGSIRDVTARNVEQAQAREIEERFRLLAEHASDIIFLRSRDGTILYVSPSIARNLGFDAEALVGKNSLSLLHPDEVPRLENAWRETVFTKKRPFLSQARFRHKDGRHLWFESVSEPVLDDKGRVTACVTATRNTTEQLQADDERTRFGRIIEDSLNEIYVCDQKTFKFTFVNRGARENLGYSLKELKDMTPLDIKPDYTKRKLMALIQPLVDGRKPRVTYVTRHQRKNGTAYDVEVNVQFSEAGERPVFIAIVEDITQKLKAAREKEAADARFRMLTEYGSDIIFHRDQAGKVIYVSPSIQRHLGYDPKRLVGKPTWAYIHPDDRKLIAKWRDTVLKKGRTYRSMARMRTNRGKYLWFDAVTEPIRDEKGKIIYSVTTARNVNEQVRAQEEREQFQKIIEDSLNEVYVIDPKTLRFRFANNRAVANTGYTLDELKTMAPFDLSVEEDVASIRKILDPVLKKRRKKAFYSGTIRRKDGTTYDIEVEVQLTQTADGPAFVAMLEDVTDKKFAAEQLRQAQKMEVVGQLTGGIAHDFNNLLTAILGSLRLLQHEKISAGAKELLDLAVASTKRGAELTHRLLAFARKQNLEPTLVDISEAVGGLETLLKRTLGETINVQIHRAPRSLQVRIDPSEFESAVLNLAINARDAMPSGGDLLIEVGEVTIDSEMAKRHETRAGRFILTTVTDTGLGMSKEVLKRALEPFFTTKGVGQGSGLGLSMVFGFVKQSGGHLNIYSEPGRGTSVKIYLPLDLSPKVTGAKRVRARPPDAASDLAGKVILLAEDDESVREFARRALIGRNFRVLEAKDGAEALRLIGEAKAIDLLVTDMVMPDNVSGFDVADRFHQRFPGGQILFCSGYPERVIRKNAETGLKGAILPKPYELTALLTKVVEILRAPPA